MAEIRNIYRRVRLLNVATCLLALLCGLGFAVPALLLHSRSFGFASIALIVLAWLSFLTDQALAGFGRGRLASTSLDMIEIVVTAMAWLPLVFGLAVAALVWALIPH